MAAQQYHKCSGEIMNIAVDWQVTFVSKVCFLLYFVV